MRIYMKI